MKPIQVIFIITLSIIGSVFADCLVIDDFEDGDVSDWGIVGAFDGSHLGISAFPSDIEGEFCLRGIYYNSLFPNTFTGYTYKDFDPGIDFSDYDSLHFWVRGLSRGHFNLRIVEEDGDNWLLIFYPVAAWNLMEYSKYDFALDFGTDGIFGNSRMQTLSITPPAVSFPAPIVPDSFFIDYLVFTVTEVGIDSQNISSKPNIRIGPNPFNSSISISIDYKVNQVATVEIFDNLGNSIQKCKTDCTNYVWIPHEEMKSGLYFCRIEIGGFRFNRKLVYLK